MVGKGIITDGAIFSLFIIAHLFLNTFFTNHNGILYGHEEQCFLRVFHNIEKSCVVLLSEKDYEAVCTI